MVRMADNPVFSNGQSPVAGLPAMANMHITNIGKTPAVRTMTQERFLRYRLTATKDPAAMRALTVFLDREFSILDKKMAEVRNNGIIPLIGVDLAPNDMTWQTEQIDETLSH